MTSHNCHLICNFFKSNKPGIPFLEVHLSKNFPVNFYLERKYKWLSKASELEIKTIWNCRLYSREIQKMFSRTSAKKEFLKKNYYVATLSLWLNIFQFQTNIIYSDPINYQCNVKSNQIARKYIRINLFPENLILTWFWIDSGQGQHCKLVLMLATINLFHKTDLYL